MTVHDPALEELRANVAVPFERAQAMLDNSGAKAVTPQMVRTFAKTARQRIRLDVARDDLKIQRCAFTPTPDDEGPNQRDNEQQQKQPRRNPAGQTVNEDAEQPSACCRQPA